MPGIRLRAERIGVSPYYFPGDRSGVPAEIPLDRLFAALVILPADAAGDRPPQVIGDRWAPDAVVDTGAPLSLFPYPVWKPFGSAVTWLEQSPPAVGARRVTVLGGRWAYRFGRVRVGVIDTDRRWLPAARLNAWFLDDAPGAPRQAILGLRCHLFDRRRLRQEPAAPDGAPRWCLEDA